MTWNMIQIALIQFVMFGERTIECTPLWNTEVGASWHGVPPLQIEGNMDGESCTGAYYRTLNLIGQEELNLVSRWKFQQNNDPKHTAQITRGCFAWPRLSPDLIPSIYFWKIWNSISVRRIVISLGNWRWSAKRSGPIIKHSAAKS